MCKVNYCGGKIPLLLGVFKTRVEAEGFIINDHENEMIVNAEEGIFEEMNHREKWDFYGEELEKYSIEEMEEMAQ